MKTYFWGESSSWDWLKESVAPKKSSNDFEEMALGNIKQEETKIKSCGQLQDRVSKTLSKSISLGTESKVVPTLGQFGRVQHPSAIYWKLYAPSAPSLPFYASSSAFQQFLSTRMSPIPLSKVLIICTDSLFIVSVLYSQFCPTLWLELAELRMPSLNFICK